MSAIITIKKGKIKMFNQFGIRENIANLSEEVEKDIENEISKINKISEYNSLKVLMAFQKYNLSEMHFRRNNRIWV